jgi:hypothetical protein
VAAFPLALQLASGELPGIAPDVRRDIQPLLVLQPQPPLPPIAIGSGASLAEMRVAAKAERVRESLVLLALKERLLEKEHYFVTRAGVGAGKTCVWRAIGGVALASLAPS